MRAQNSIFTDQLLAELEPALLKYAQIHLRRNEGTQDCVQEVMLAILANGGQYTSSASYKTYIFSILKNKIADCLRLHYQSLAKHQNVNEDDFDIWFDKKVTG